MICVRFLCWSCIPTSRYQQDMALVTLALALFSLHWTHASTTDCRWAEYKVTFIKQEMQTPTWQQPKYRKRSTSTFGSGMLTKSFGTVAARHLALSALKKAAQLPARWTNHFLGKLAASALALASASAPASVSTSASVSAGESWQPCLLSLLCCLCLPSHFRRNLPGVFNRLH